MAIQETSFEDNPILAKILEDFTKQAERRFISAVRAEGLELTGELLASIHAAAVERGQGFIRSSVMFSELLRIKDMKQLRYTTVPPLRAMVDFVEKIGIGRFAYVPGYPTGVTPRSEHAAVLRVARGLQFHFKSYPNIKRGYRGIYNDELKYNVLPLFYETMEQAACAWAAEEFRQNFGKEVFFAPTDKRNWARMMASQTAYSEGKIDTSNLKYNFPKNRK
ncbi:hypothetical protein [Siphonobacter curvatus]|uniref:Uncharacterized protein n=1 Tax=Siphonobacter curvatus TaxID=2094562 RepID=A0A2S7IN43_9BACT|nr:hypothetical protein [Siphonobacter curvatus]PQA59163.1 hypothetical protein C5O19_05770 [Siphonobacter curvatus]